MTKTQQKVLTLVRQQLRTQIIWRRHFHQYPELSNNEYKTTEFIKRKLTGLGLTTLPVKYPTGVIADLKGGSNGPVIALRCDIDALAVKEKTGLPYRSKIDGVMHACGHDVHTAVVLGTAAVLAKCRKEFAGRVRFIFQPAEENPPGGAIPMIANHALKNVKMILSLHVDPLLPTGMISLRDGPTMASVYDFDIIIHGKGGHAAVPHRAVDPIVVAAQVIDRIQMIVSREINPFMPIVITFGQIHGGTARNIIPETVTLSGTARVISASLAQRLPNLIKRAVNGICQSHGVGADIIETGRYPVLVNHPQANKLLRESWESVYGKGLIEETDITMGGEDFASYLEQVPGAMFRLGIMNKKIGAVHPWHSPSFKVDEKAILFGTTLLSQAVLKYLE
jgi:amidohydrolase